MVGRGVDADAVEAQQESKQKHEQTLRAAGEKRKKINGAIK